MSTPRPSDLLLLAFLALGAATVSPAFAAPVEDDALAQYRERFKQGLDRYNEGAIAEAIGYWAPIYRELGEPSGYRLAYNLGVAYEQLGETTAAAEHLQAFLGQVDERRARGEALGAVVAREEADARSRMADLLVTKGRILLHASTPPRAVKVDAAEPRLAGFVAWVAPGEHTVTFAPGTSEAETKTVAVAAGALVEIAPSTSTSTSTSTPTPTSTPTSTSTPTPPFSLQLVLLSGGITIATGVVAAALYANATSLHDRFAAEQASSPLHTLPGGDRAAFDTARTGAYVAIGCTAGLAAMTGGLAAWYAAARSKRGPSAAPAVGIEPGGAQLGLSGRF